MSSILLLLFILGSFTGCLPTLPVFFESVDVALSVFEEVVEEIIEYEVEDAND